MTERERKRLIELLVEADKKCADTNQCENCVGFSKGEWCSEHLIADHLLANGVIVPPVAVGQTVWFVRNGKVIETSIDKVVVKHGGLYFKMRCNGMYETAVSAIGKTVFLSQSTCGETGKGI